MARRLHELCSPKLIQSALDQLASRHELARSREQYVPGHELHRERQSILPPGETVNAFVYRGQKWQKAKGTDHPANQFFHYSIDGAFLGQFGW